MKKKYNVVYLGAVEGFEVVTSVLNDCCDVTHVEAVVDKVASSLMEADALVDASMKVKITNSILEQAGNLKIVSCATTGSDHISREKALERGIKISTLKEDKELLQNLTPAAELSWALLMACARKLSGAYEHVKRGGWVREEFPGVMLNGKQLGLVGFGRIGGWMSKYAKAFGMKVIVYDPYVSSLPESVEAANLEDLFANSDFISIHVHLTEDTRDLVSSKLLSSIKKGAVLINTSRGDIVSQEGLLMGLKSGRISAAGLDVLQGEPDIDQSPLVQYCRENSNLIITPHIGGFSPDAVTLVCKRAAEKVKKCFSE
ncbi:NAD(P)-dependent oxidoreductase [Litoribacillus peritrichatus]|uniref:Hydroxypyruvate reductase n=1 Tax=Litoribacillus peritrichatus TaxID=718191 RepID=A0ABP7MJE5_9GAMM